MNLHPNTFGWQNLKRYPQLANFTAKVRVPSALQREIKATFDHRVIAEIVRDFMIVMFFPEVAKEWKRLATKAHTPKIREEIMRKRQVPFSTSVEAEMAGFVTGRPERKAVNLYREEYAKRFGGSTADDEASDTDWQSVLDENMMQAFGVLWNKIQVARIVQKSGYSSVVIGGNELLDLRLNEYMPIGPKSTKSQFNRLWFAVEFGTGSEVWSEHMRNEGPTKDASGDGSWWVGPRAGQGLHVLGQKGFHIFHEPDTRLPRAKWANFIKEELPPYLLEKLQERSKLRIKKRGR